MLSQVAVEALYSATYVENYMDYVENLPDAVQRHLSRIRDIDVQYRKYLKDGERLHELWSKLLSSNTDHDIVKRNKLMSKLQKTYINAQELGDEKMQTVSQLQELIDYKSRQVDLDFKNLDYGKEEHQSSDINLIGNNSIGQLTNSGGNNNNSVSGSGNSSQKASRPQSPATMQQANMIKLEHNLQSGFNSNIQQSNISSGQRVNTPTISERSSNSNNITSSGGSGNNNSQNVIGERTTSKRARRPRNEHLNTNNMMDIGGNESNSANESVAQHHHSKTTHHQSTNIGGSGGGSSTSAGTSSAGQKKSANNQTGSGAGGKKKKRKTRGQGTTNQTNVRETRDTRDETPPPDPIDPDEPTYCLCDQISFGEMILCDNDLCPIEWFHFSCVALMSKPKGKWFCPNCRGDRPNIMKPKAQFLKELERYNKEREEKT